MNASPLDYVKYIKGKISVIKEFKNLVTKIKVLSEVCIKKIVLRGAAAQQRIGESPAFL